MPDGGLRQTSQFGLDNGVPLFFLCSKLCCSGRKAMARFKVALTVALSVSALALLSACDNGPSAVKQTAAGSQMATAQAPER
jgi:hypothetical protein